MKHGKSCACLLIILISTLQGYSQKHDYVWLSGYMGNDTGFVGYWPPFGFYYVNLHYKGKKIYGGKLSVIK